ncbi:LysE family translocator [Rhodococcus opacus]|uniref:LysE family translocator n=1 Tax=Rhodococcus opacus TaxID=37919 RepID=UPI0022358844|nr:LysE family translocator [Rhodococcus opacus]UZG60201.1 LysE family translocator [Rhodococcus opacus]
MEDFAHASSRSANMSVDRWLAFLSLLLIVLCTPGPDFAVIVRHAVNEASRGIAAAIGVILGLFTHTLAVAVGLAALIAAHPGALSVLRMMGAAYLVWLGTRAVWAAIATPAAGQRDVAEQSGGDTGTAWGAALRQGYSTNVLNPKALLFFLGLIPQFVGTTTVTGLAALLAVVTIAVAAVWWAVVLGSIRLTKSVTCRARTGSDRVPRWLEWASGLTFLSLGVILAVEQ